MYFMCGTNKLYENIAAPHTSITHIIIITDIHTAQTLKWFVYFFPIRYIFLFFLMIRHWLPTIIFFFSMFLATLTLKQKMLSRIKFVSRREYPFVSYQSVLFRVLRTSRLLIAVAAKQTTTEQISLCKMRIIALNQCNATQCKSFN